MKKGLTCFGFVSGKRLEKNQVLDFSTLNQIRCMSTRDDQFNLTTPHKTKITTAKSLLFSRFSLVNLKFRQMPYKAYTHRHNPPECFGFVSGNFCRFLRRLGSNRKKSYFASYFLNQFTSPKTPGEGFSYGRMA